MLLLLSRSQSQRRKREGIKDSRAMKLSHSPTTSSSSSTLSSETTMKSIVACCLLALIVAIQAQWVDNSGFSAVGYPGPTASQYHSQDELGQSHFGYAHPGQASTSYRDALGNQIGSYAYINPEGKEVRVSYTADHRGFRVLSNDLPVSPYANLVAPVQVQDTPEVAAAKASHFAAVAAAKARAPVAPTAPVSTPVVTPVAAPVAAPVVRVTPVAAAVPTVASLPVPVQDTPEVAAAKREHAVKWNAAKAAADAAKLRDYYAGVPSAHNYGAPLGYSMPYYHNMPYNYASPSFPASGFAV